MGADDLMLLLTRKPPTERTAAMLQRTSRSLLVDGRLSTRECCAVTCSRSSKRRKHARRACKGQDFVWAESDDCCGRRPPAQIARLSARRLCKASASQLICHRSQTAIGECESMNL